jgi:hypothetical protein
MARKTQEEKMQDRIDHYENVLESLEHLPHIKHLYFNAAGEYFLYCKEYHGKKYARLSIQAVYMEEGSAEPPANEVASRDNDGKVKAIYVAPSDPTLEIVKTLTMEQSKKHFAELLNAAKLQLEDMFEPRAPKKTTVRTKTTKTI